jgi:sirohydrochlorin ferrochelatase
MTQAVLLVSHGSKAPKARQEVDALAARLSAKLKSPVFEYAFLEVDKPSIPEGLEACVRRGATEITLILNFLNSGRHVLEHVPQIVAEFRATHPSIICRLTPCVGSHEGMDSLYLDLVRQSC